MLLISVQQPKQELAAPLRTGLGAGIERERIRIDAVALPAEYRPESDAERRGHVLRRPAVEAADGADGGGRHPCR